MIKCECGGVYCQEKERMMCGTVVRSKKCNHCLRMIPSERVSQEVRTGFKIYNHLLAPPWNDYEYDCFVDEELYAEDGIL